MDIESYRQLMKDVMIVKTILHQLDRLLKHSDGANMTVCFIIKENFLMKKKRNLFLFL